MNDPRIDAAFLEPIDSKKGFFGLTYHYIIRTNGHIEIGRNPKTISSAGKRHLQHSQIVIGIVGGLSFDADNNSVKQVANETPEQEASLEWLMQALADTLRVPLEVTDGREYLQSRKHLPEDAHEEPRDENGEPILDEYEQQHEQDAYEVDDDDDDDDDDITPAPLTHSTGAMNL